MRGPAASGSRPVTPRVRENTGACSRFTLQITYAAVAATLTIRGSVPDGFPEETLDVNQSLPGWARAADFVAVSLALVAVTVAASGGFHATIQGIRVNLTSPYRVLAWAVALTLVRHAFMRERP